MNAAVLLPVLVGAAGGFALGMFTTFALTARAERRQAAAIRALLQGRWSA